LNYGEDDIIDCLFYKERKSTRLPIMNMNTEENYPTRKSMRADVEESIKNKKIRAMEKEFERRNRPSSCKLSKKLKKMTARLAKVLDENQSQENEEEGVPSEEPITQPRVRIPLKRCKRKPSHRPRAETFEF